MVKSDTQLYKFGTFQIDAVKRLLLCGLTPVQLPSRAFDVLVALVEHSQYVLEKDELMRLVWGDRVVEENNLTRHISTLRKVLEESPNDHRYIVTVPGRGYTFVAHVERIQTNGGERGSASHNGNTAALQAGTDVRLEQYAEHTAQVFPPDLGDAAPNTNVPLSSHRTTSSRTRWYWLTALILFLAVGGFLSFRLINTRSNPPGVNSYRDWELVRLTRTGGSVGPDISSDGKYVAYVNQDGGQTSVWILQLSTLARQQIVPPEKFFYDGLLFTRDGNELYFTRRADPASAARSLYRIPVVGGVAKKLRDDLISPVELSADGAHLAFARRNSEGKSEFIMANADAVEERVVVGHRLENPAWSPDGKVLAFSVGNASSGGENMSIGEVRLEDGLKRELSTRKWSHLGKKAWLPDGSGLIVCGRQQKVNVNQLWFVAYPSGDTRPLSNDVDGFAGVRLAADGSTLVAQKVEAVSDIWSGPLANVADARKIGAWGGAGVSFTGDKRIVYSALLSGHTDEILIMNLDGTDQKQLTFDIGNDISPVASPDGDRVVFTSDRSGNFEIWRMNVDGSNLLQLTNSAGAKSPSISPDGRWVTYLSSSGGKLFKVPLEGGDPVELLGGAVGASAVSPDGKLIGYFASGQNGWQIAVSSFEDGP